MFRQRPPRRRNRVALDGRDAVPVHGPAGRLIRRLRPGGSQAAMVESALRRARHAALEVPDAQTDHAKRALLVRYMADLRAFGEIADDRYHQIADQTDRRWDAPPASW